MTTTTGTTRSREVIPTEMKMQVWQRDSGRCVAFGHNALDHKWQRRCRPEFSYFSEVLVARGGAAVHHCFERHTVDVHAPRDGARLFGFADAADELVLVGTRFEHGYAAPQKLYGMQADAVAVQVMDVRKKAHARWQGLAWQRNLAAVPLLRVAAGDWSKLPREGNPVPPARSK